MDEAERTAKLLNSWWRCARGESTWREGGFDRPNRGLGGKSPAETARTEAGAREVETLVLRLEHGIVV